MLDIQCGPLLRYVWTDVISNPQQPVSLYTLLIVTNDLGSDYSKSPILRITGHELRDRQESIEVLSENIHQERGVTFWRWKIHITLGDKEHLIKYSINGSQEDIGFWIPAAHQSMRIVFHTCNGTLYPLNTN